MAVYYVIGIALVVWALVLTALGVTRDGFPPTRPAARRLIAVSVLLVAATVVAVVATTEREHPREEAEAKAAEKKEAEAGQPPEGPKEEGPPAAGAPAKGGTAEVVEAEYSVKLPGGSTLTAGNQTFAVDNAGKIPHDLAVEGAGQEKKTPLIDAGKKAKLEVELKPGKYKLFCTVPGHEQLGMRTEVTVR